MGLRRYQNRWFLFIVLLASSFSWGMKVDEVPNPQVERRSFVQDSAGVLGPEYTQMIDSLARQLESGTTAELAVVTIDNLEGSSIEEYAARLFKRFGIGKKEKDNGLLILFSLYDRKVRVEVGYGLEGVVTDAWASRYLRNLAIPNFKEGQYGKGLFLLARQLAMTVSAAEGKELTLSEPANWPRQVEAQVRPPRERPLVTQSSETTWSPVFIYLLVLGALALLIFVWKGIRFRKAEAKAAKEMRLKFLGPNLLIWLGGGLGALLVGLFAQHLLPVIFGFLGIAGGTTFLGKRTTKRWRKFLKNYHLKCDECGKPMKLIGETADDAFLTPEERGEEKAGGMDYEFWECPGCALQQRFEVKLRGASRCPQCKRRSLVRTNKVLQSATTTSSGSRQITETCHNPKCNYHRSWTRTIPRIVTSASSSSGGFSSSSGGFSSSGSFGGGSSGGGGASGGW